jgi:hypothetical protein
MTTLFNYDPYFDDFDENKNFMRVLFRPGYSLQARELTQLQTILSNQIERFANHIFKNGSPVIGGKVSLDDRAFYIILNSQYSGQDVVLENFLDRTIISYNSNKQARAKVIAIDNTTNTPILVVKYLSGDFFTEDDEIKVSDFNIFAQVRSNDAVGRSYVASIQEGIYYFKGQFVTVTPQFLVLETFHKIGLNTATVNLQPSYRIGIEFGELIIDEVDDVTLLDPSQGSFNYQAPGATRFKVNTTLSKRTLDSADESSFFEVIRIVNGTKTKEIDYPIYSEIEKTLARRTFEESGNYTVDPFVLSMEENYIETSNNNYVNPDFFSAILDSGKAYVGGYEVQTISPTVLGVSRARQTANVSDYDLPTNYSSYVVANTVAGSLSISNFPKLDVHCIPHTDISRASDTEYGCSKIGTLRANMIKFNDATVSDVGTSHTFTINVFDVDSTSITGTLASSGSNTRYVVLPSSFAQLPANGYQELYFSVKDGLGISIAPIRIEGSDGANKSIWLSSALPFVPSSNLFSIDSDFKTAESIVSRNGTSLTFAANIDGDSKLTNGDAFITEPTRQNLIFDVPFESIKANGITNFDFFSRKVYSNRVSNAGGVITLSTTGTDTFAFAGTPGQLSDSVILNNIICFVRYDSASNGTSGITPNTVLSLANNLFTVTAIDNSTIEIDLDTAGVRADFVVTTKVNNAEDGSNGAIRTKQLYPLSNTSHEAVAYTVDSSTGLTSGDTGTVTPIVGGYVFPDLGVTYFDNETPGAAAKVTNLKTPGVPVSLEVPDVYEIVKIIDSKTSTGNITTSMLTDSSHDITNRYELDNGQRRTHYDHATIKLRRGFSSPTGGSIYVLYKYLRHGSAPSPQNIGLFTVNSYLGVSSNITYNDISKFLDSEGGRILSGRSSFDFRPTRAIAGTELSGAVCPDPDQTAEVSFEHYLSRIDRVVIKPSKEIVVIEGQSAIKPLPPPVNKDDMLIYTLFVPPYTESVKEVRADFQNNRRFTMRDIGGFENRIKGLEYYVSLNSLEKNANDSKILDSNGLERSKYGILVDNFTNTDSQATYNDVGFDNRCLIEKSELKPASLMRTFKLKWIESASTGLYKVIGTGSKKSLILNYTNSVFASQPYATKTISVASALYGNFNGTLKLFPEFTSEQDTGVTAKVTLNSTQGLDNAFNFVNDAFRFISDQNPSWINDKDNPFAKIVDSKWYESTTQVTNQSVFLGANPNGHGRRFGNLQTTTDRVYVSKGAELNQKQLSTSTSEVDLGSFVTDVSINPYIKPRSIVFVAGSLRPKSRFYAFFDNVLVDKFTVTPTKLALATATQPFKSGELALIANNTGELTTAITSFINDNGPYNLIVISEAEIASSNVRVINETGLGLSGKYIFGVDSGLTTTISSVLDHKSGITRAVSASTITLASDAPSVNISGNTLTLVKSTDSQAGHGSVYDIIDYNTTTKIATISQTTTTEERTKNYTYSIGFNQTNEFGDITGIFYPPQATFRSGERTLRLTESFNNTYDKDAISFAEKTFVSSGVTVNKTNLINTVYNIDVGVKFVGNATSPLLKSTTVSSRITSTWATDPLAQTFFVDEESYPNGLYLDSANVFFSAKDSTLPIRIQIRPTVNGLPSGDFWYPESVVEKKSSEVIVTSNPSVDVNSTKTTFTFPSPIFLAPGLYALVILTDSPDYIVWTAEKGQTTLNNQNVSINPYVGTLYKSQNAMEYVPYLNEDLMFELNRCVFSTGTATFSLQSEKQSRKYYIDRFRLLETSIIGLSDSPVSVNYSFISKPIGGSKETVYRNITPFLTYEMGTDNLYPIGSRRKEIQDQGDFTVNLQISSNDNSVSPLVSLESLHLNGWENFIDNGEIDAEDFNIITLGAGYSNSNNIIISSNTGIGANVRFITDGVKGNVIGFNVFANGSGYTDDFTISFPDTSDASGNITANAVVTLNSEFDSSGGPCLARYITKPITLADGFDAGDLRVFLGANKPAGCEVHVFYKLLSSSDVTKFKDRPYQKMEVFNPTVSPSIDENEFREYEYRPSITSDEVSYISDNGVTYDSFKTFAIKILMTSEDPSVIPRVRELRIIALPTG